MAEDKSSGSLRGKGAEVADALQRLDKAEREEEEARIRERVTRLADRMDKESSSPND
jgi:hypothetical protein